MLKINKNIISIDLRNNGLTSIGINSILKHL